MKTLTVSCGDINGIGPEIIFKSLNEIYKECNSEIILIIPENVFELTSKLVRPEFRFSRFSSSDKRSSGVKILFLEDAEIEIGEPTETSGATAFKSLDKAISLIESGRAEGLVTAPLSKEAFALAGVNYNGHTDLLAERSGTVDYMMTFLSNDFKTGLATVHVPIKEVDSLLTPSLLKSKLDVAVKTLRNDFLINSPEIAVLGLNPHAGENGNIGRKEVEVISPVIEEFKSEADCSISGPFVPDAFFATRKYLEFDFVLSMYHDQALIPFKMINFNSGVNFTAGLPYVRTSPDHGTAFDIAGKGAADESSFTEALIWAEKILANRNEKN